MVPRVLRAVPLALPTAPVTPMTPAHRRPIKSLWGPGLGVPSCLEVPRPPLAPWRRFDDPPERCSLALVP